MAKNIDKYAVIKVAGKQYKIAEGKELLVDKLASENIYYFVLLYKDGDKVQVGKPGLEGIKVAFKVLNQEEKGKKIDVFKYKSKSRYRKHTGFRPKYTRLLVEKIA